MLKRKFAPRGHLVEDLPAAERAIRQGHRVLRAFRQPYRFPPRKRVIGTNNRNQPLRDAGDDAERRQHRRAIDQCKVDVVSRQGSKRTVMIHHLEVERHLRMLLLEIRDPQRQEIKRQRLAAGNQEPGPCADRASLRRAISSARHPRSGYGHSERTSLLRSSI